MLKVASGRRIGLITAPTVDGGVPRANARNQSVALWVLGGVSALTLALSALLWSHQRQVDFDVYRMGGQLVLGTGLYSSHISVFSGNLLFTYTPLAALTFWPISHLSTWMGQLVWDLANVATLGVLIAVSLASAQRRPLRRSDWRLALIALTPVGLLLWPLRYDFELGQINLMLILMIVADLSMDLSMRGRKLPRGVLVGLAAAIKLTPLIFIPYLFVTRQWAAARNATVTFLIATGIMFAVAPRASWQYFTKYAFDVGRIGDASITNNQTLRAAVARTDIPIPHDLVNLSLVAVFCLGLALAATAYRQSSELLGILLCAYTGLLVSPISWEHHYVWCVPLLVWLTFGLDRPRLGLVWAAVAAIIFMVMPPAQSVHPSALSYVRENAYVLSAFAFLLLVGAALWIRNRRQPSGRPGLQPICRPKLPPVNPRARASDSS